MQDFAPPPVPILESAVLAYRLDAQGQPLVLVLTTAKTRRWGIPKGRVEPHLSFGDNAAKEAFEEAGVLGEVAPNASGMYRTNKRLVTGERVIEVWVYLMKVTGTADTWPEKGRRELRWVSCKTAAKLLREPFLGRLCRQLGAERDRLRA